MPWQKTNNSTLAFARLAASDACCASGRKRLIMRVVRIQVKPDAKEANDAEGAKGAAEKKP